MDRELELTLNELPEMMARHRKLRGSKASTRDVHTDPALYRQTKRRVKKQEQLAKTKKGERIAGRAATDQRLVQLDADVDGLKRRLKRARGAEAGQIQMQLDRAQFLRNQRVEAAKSPRVAVIDQQIETLAQQLVRTEDTREVARINEELQAARDQRNMLIDDIIRGNAEGELWELESAEFMATRRKRPRPRRASQAAVDAARAATVHGEQRTGSGAGTSDVHTAPGRYRQIRQGVERRAEVKRRARATKARAAAAVDPRVTALEEQIAELERQHRHALNRDATKAAQLHDDLTRARNALRLLKAELAGQTQESELWELFV